MADPDSPLAGRRVVVARPVGSGRALARRIAALGGEPLVLPGATLRPAAGTSPAQLAAALAADVVVFTSPASVRFARALFPRLRIASRTAVLAPGHGTARALARAGVAAQVPVRADSEGLLSLPALRGARGRRVALVGAPGGRGLLDAALAQRGARVSRIHVYERALPRWRAVHRERAARIDSRTLVLLSSAEALDALRALMGDDAWRRALRATAVASSARLAALARRRGFARVVRARSALAADLVDAGVAAARRVSR